MLEALKTTVMTSKKCEESLEYRYKAKKLPSSRSFIIKMRIQLPSNTQQNGRCYIASTIEAFSVPFCPQIYFGLVCLILQKPFH